MRKVELPSLFDVIGREVPSCPGITWQNFQPFDGVIRIGVFKRFYIKGPYYNGNVCTFRTGFGDDTGHLMYAVRLVESIFEKEYPAIIMNGLFSVG